MTGEKNRKLTGNGVGDCAVGVKRRAKGIIGERSHDAGWCGFA